MKQLFLILSLTVLAGPAAAAGFDCAKAATPDEKAVCADKRLSALDSLMSKAFKEAKDAKDYDDVQQIARDFLDDRKSCRTDKACILSTYVAAISELGPRGGGKTRLPDDITAATMAAGPAKDTGALPETLGQCVSTAVDSVHSRLEGGDFDAGTGIDYKNSGYQVSYDREEKLIASKPGDKVTMCLVSIPHRCPPDDDRGRTYMVTNERTKATWILADSQHMCGGA